MKKFTSSFILFFSLSFFIVNVSSATNYFWKPAGTSRSFKIPGNWKTVSCAGSTATGVPGSGDTINFSNCSIKECHIDTNATVKMVIILGTYNDTLYQDNGKTFTFEKASLKGGVFMGGNSAISCTKDVTIDGTAFKSTSDVFTIAGDFTYKTGGFTHNSGKIVFNKGTSSTTTISSTSNSVTVSLYKAEFGAPTHHTTFNIRNIDLQVNNDLTVTGDSSLFMNSNSGSVIQAKGNVTSSNTNSTGGGTVTIEINGTGSQTLSDNSGTDAAGKLPNIKINKSAGTLSLSGSIVMGGSTELNYVAGTLSAGTSTIIFYYNNVIRNNSGGTMNLYNAQIIGSGGIDSVKGTVTITHDFATTGSGNCNIKTTNGGSGTLEVQGDIAWNNSATSTFGNVSFKCSGGNSQTFSGAIEPIFYNLEVNKSGGSLTLSHALSIANSLNLTAKNIITTSTYLLTLKIGSTVSNASSSSFVSGPLKKIGNSSFTFPLGYGTSYKPLGITAPSTSTDAFTAQYFSAQQSHGSSKDSLTYLSTCEYWNLTRTTGSSNIMVTLTWDNSTCAIYSLSTLRVAVWDGSKWSNRGPCTTSGNTAAGSIQTNSNQSTYGDFIIAKRSPALYAHAGSDDDICNGSSATIGGSPGATGGVSPFSYEWFPPFGLSSTTAENPTAIPNQSRNYILKVTDLDLSIAYDTVKVVINSLPVVFAGGRLPIFQGATISLGGNPSAQSGKVPYTYAWVPSTSLSANNVANPLCSATSSLKYSLTVTDDNGCIDSDYVSVLQIPYSYGIADSFSLLSGDTIIVADSVDAIGKAGATYFVDSKIKASLGREVNNSLVTNALTAMSNAITDIVGLSGSTISNNLSGITITDGIYKISGNARLNGTLTFEGDTESVFIIDISDSLIISNYSKVILIGVEPYQITFNAASAIVFKDTTYMEGIFFSSGNVTGGFQTGAVTIQSNGTIKFNKLLFIPVPPWIGTFISAIPGNVIPTNVRTIDPDFLGFNGTNAVGALTSNWGYNPGFSLFINQLSTLYTGTIRFIAGSDANYWNYEKGVFLTTEELPNFCEQYSSPPFCGYGVPNNFFSSTTSYNLVSDFKYGIDPGLFLPNYVFNMLTDSLSDAIDMLFDAKCKGLPVKYGEFGNEFYLSDNPHFNMRFPNATAYADSANRWADQIKATFPGMKVAAIGATRKVSNPRSQDWNDDLGINADGSILFHTASSTSGIDAITFHVYPSASGVNMTTGGVVAMKEAFLKPLTDIENMTTSVTSGGTGEFTVFENADYFEGWITEYGLTDNDVTGMFGTWAQGLYQALMTLRFLDESHITHVYNQTIQGVGIPKELYPSDGKDQPSCAIFDENGSDDVVSNPFEFTCIGNALLPICKAMRFSNSANKINFTLKPISDNFLDDAQQYPILYGYYFGGEVSDDAIIINLSDKDLSIRTLLFPDGVDISETYYGYNYSNSVNDVLTYVKGNADVTGSKGVKIESKPFTLFPFIIGTGPIHIIKLPKYSITHLAKYKAEVTAYASSNEICPNQSVTISAYCPTADHIDITVLGNTSMLSGSRVSKAYVNISSSTTVTVSAKKANNEEIAATSVGITVSSLPSVSIAASPSSICIGNYATLTVSGASNPVNWTPSIAMYASQATTYPVMSGQTVYVSPPTTQSYTVHVVNSGCYCAAVTPIVITVAPHADAGPDIFMCDDVDNGHTKPQLGPTVSVGGGYTYSWVISPSTGLVLNNSSIEMPIINADPTATGIYTATVTMTGGGCTSSDATTITVVTCCASDGIGADIVLDPFSTLNPDINDVYWNMTDLGTLITSLGGGTQYTFSTNIVEGSGVNNTDNEIYINGPFTMNANNSTFQNCSNIVMGPSASILIPDGKNCIFDNNIIQACDTRWKGIYGGDEDTKLTFTNNHIYDANNAIFLKFDADYDIYSNVFDRNYNHIRLQEFKNEDGNDEDRDLYGNTFNFTGSVTDTAIALEWNGGTPLGDASQSPNTINGANLFGVAAFKSTINAFYNSISNTPMGIQLFQTQPNLTYPFNYTSTIGGQGTNQPNTFTDCNTGVSYLNMDIHFVKNNFIDNETAIISDFNENREVNFNHNMIYQSTGTTKTGISLNQNSGSTLNLWNNDITINSTDANATGIYLSNFADPLGIYIGVDDQGTDKGNIITMTDGFAAIHVQSGSNAFCKYNEIHLDQTTPIAPVYGILFDQSSDVAEISNNVISGNGSSDMVNKRAISISDCSDYEIGCNDIDETEYGLQFVGACPHDDDQAINGNRFDNYTYGIVLDGVDVSGYGTAFTSMGNINESSGNVFLIDNSGTPDLYAKGTNAGGNSVNYFKADLNYYPCEAHASGTDGAVGSEIQFQPSDPSSISCQDCLLRLENENNDNNFSNFLLYPNPVVDKSELMLVNYDPDSFYSLLVADLSGKRLIEQQLDRTSSVSAVNCSTLAAGIYVVTVYKNYEAAWLTKLIKVK